MSAGPFTGTPPAASENAAFENHTGAKYEDLPILDGSAERAPGAIIDAPPRPAQSKL
jgi:hypothetical protein